MLGHCYDCIMHTNMSSPPLRLLIAVGALLLAGCAAQTTASSFRDCRDCPQMVVVPAGSTTVGGSSQEQANERVPDAIAAHEQPQHRITIARRIAVGKFEITRAEYARFVTATHREMAAGCSALDMSTDKWLPFPALNWRSPGFAQTDRHPVICVSWDDATAYTVWLASSTGKPYRLLSEAEWEYAARAGTDTARYWGDAREPACKYANVADLTLAAALAAKEPAPDTYFQCRDGYVHTAPVGSFRPNEFGLFDMEGNVWEMVQECDLPTLDAAAADGSVRRGGDCAGHMDRGGSWVNSPKYLRIAARHKDVTGIRNTVLGFRVARDLP